MAALCSRCPLAVSFLPSQFGRVQTVMAVGLASLPYLARHIFPLFAAIFIASFSFSVANDSDALSDSRFLCLIPLAWKTCAVGAHQHCGVEF
eukprot:4406218-Pleurochrysis_carterae.AAC.1